MNNETIDRLIGMLAHTAYLFGSEIHGITHWKQVDRNALYLAGFCNAEPRTVCFLPTFMTQCAGTKI
jgi:hypothetical protein